MLIEIKEGDQVKCDLDGKDYTIMKILNGVVTLKSTDGRETVTGIISFKMHYKKNEGTISK